MVEESTSTENEPLVARKLLDASGKMVDSAASLVAARKASKRCIKYQLLNEYYVYYFNR